MVEKTVGLPAVSVIRPELARAPVFDASTIGIKWIKAVAVAGEVHVSTFLTEPVARQLHSHLGSSSLICTKRWKGQVCWYKMTK